MISAFAPDTGPAGICMEFSLTIDQAKIRQTHDTASDGLQLADLEAKRVITVEELFSGAKEVLIRHQSALYRLKITRQGKLILNK